MINLRVLNSTETYSPGKLVCVGRNYREHAEELGNVVPESPLLFLKPSSAIIFSGDTIIHPSFSGNLHYELELVLLIGMDIKDADNNEADDAIAGYGVGLDMTLRDIQSEEKKLGHPWTLSKCFDTSAVLSDLILRRDYQLKMDECITLKVNGQVKQHACLDKMIFKPVELVKYISSRMRLEKGDLIFTDTPAGVGRVLRGDHLEGEITNVGRLSSEII